MERPPQRVAHQRRQIGPGPEFVEAPPRHETQREQNLEVIGQLAQDFDVNSGNYVLDSIGLSADQRQAAST